MTSDRQLTLAARRFVARFFDHVAKLRADGRLDDEQLAHLVVNILQSHAELKSAIPHIRALLGPQIDADAPAVVTPAPAPAPEETKEPEEDGDKTGDGDIIFLVVNP